MAAKDIESAFNTVDMDKSGEISKRVSSHFSYVFRFSQIYNKQLRLLLKNRLEKIMKESNTLGNYKAISAQSTKQQQLEYQ